MHPVVPLLAIALGLRLWHTGIMQQVYQRYISLVARAMFDAWLYLSEQKSRRGARSR